MERIKSIFKNKMLLLALLSFVISLISLASVGYAWFITVKENKVEGFVATVGESGYEYQFSQVISDKLIQSETYQTEKTMPGEVNIFILRLNNTGKGSCILDVYFSDVHSEKYVDNEFSKTYTNEYEKIQYSYSYCCDLIAQVPNDTVVKETEGELITIPSDEELAELDWKKIDDSVNEAKTDIYFNAIDNNIERNDYYLIKGLELEEDSTILIYFTIKFQPNCKIPEIYQEEIPSNISFDGQFYSNQRFVIGNLVIDNKSKINE